MHRITESSRTHGTQPVSEDSMPSAGLFVRLLSPFYFHSLFSSLFTFSFFSLKSSRAAKPYTYDAHILKYVRQLYLGASWTEACYYYFASIKLITCESFPHMYLVFAIICIDMT